MLFHILYFHTKHLNKKSQQRVLIIQLDHKNHFQLFFYLSDLQYKYCFEQAGYQLTELDPFLPCEHLSDFLPLRVNEARVHA